jgi:hypothetical protein
MTGPTVRRLNRYLDSPDYEIIRRQVESAPPLSAEVAAQIRRLFAATADLPAQK